MPAYAWINIALAAVAATLAVPSLVLLAECVLAVGKRNSRVEIGVETVGTVCVLIPAHDEQQGIGDTVREVAKQLRADDRVLVIADNCSDGTATAARHAGAEVLVRTDALRRGKGYALAAGMEQLASAPPDVIIVLDADMTASPGAVDALRGMVMQSQRPVQLLDLLAPPADPSTRDLFSWLAFTVKNHVRPLGLSRLGMPCPLFGTGMAFPYAVLRDAPLAGGNIVEDMQLGIDLAIRGHPARFCPAAAVTGVLPQPGSVARTQRTRWEHGHVRTLVTQVPRLLRASVLQLRPDLVAMALDLSVPPLSLLVMLLIAMIAAAAGWAAVSGMYLPLVISTVSLAAVTVAIGLAWACYGRSQISARQLIGGVGYLLWKVPIYLALLIRPQRDWVRTPRQSQPPAADL